MQAKLHPRQQERLRALRSYDVLDTAPEQDFDDIVRLAAAICETPISLVSLVDADRQFFKAEIGVGEAQTELERSICSHAILEPGLVEIEDTMADARSRDNPFCSTDPHLRFYAGALLVTDEGLPLGTLCVLDVKPRVLTPLQRDALRVLARQVMVQMEMRKALRSAEILRREVDHRVKNSLQSLSSLIRIQKRASDHDETVEALDSISSRIDAMARLHQQLYSGTTPEMVEAETYLHGIVAELRQLAPAGVAIAVDSDAMPLNPRQAVAIGTFVNEFATNSFNYAFPDGRPGNITIALRMQPDGQVHLRCGDDGVGLQAQQSGIGSGLGMTIVEIICNDLGGTLTLDDQPPGLVATLAFRPIQTSDALRPAAE